MHQTSLRIWAYCLMLNHVHFVAVPPAANSLGIALRGAHGTYADYFNTKYGHVGHLWGERFHSSVLDEAYLWNAIRYVERNPVRAGIVNRAEDYRWSSAPVRCGLRSDPLLSDDCPLLTAIPDWSAWLRNELPVEHMSFLRQHTHTGRPCGDDAFVRELGVRLGRDLGTKRPGPRPVVPQGTDCRLPFPGSGIE
jgi:putative transposase